MSTPGRQKQRLELKWIGKDERPRSEPRILVKEPERAYHEAHRVAEQDIFDNIADLRRQLARVLKPQAR